MINDDWLKKRRLWADIVEGEIPPDRLVDVFRRAIRTHNSEFPISVSELLPAWELMKAEERQATLEQTNMLRSCATCLEAQKQNVPCPYHQRKYKIHPEVIGR